MATPIIASSWLPVLTLLPLTLLPTSGSAGKLLNDVSFQPPARPPPTTFPPTESASTSMTREPLLPSRLPAIWVKRLLKPSGRWHPGTSVARAKEAQPLEVCKSSARLPPYLSPRPSLIPPSNLHPTYPSSPIFPWGSRWRKGTVFNGLE